MQILLPILNGIKNGTQEKLFYKLEMLYLTIKTNAPVNLISLLVLFVSSM